MTFPARHWLQLHRNRLTRLAIIGGVVLLSIVLGRMARRFEPEMLIIAAGLPLGIAAFVFTPLEYLVVGIVAAAAFVQFSLPTGTGSNVPMSMLVTLGVVALWLVRMLIVDRRLRLVHSPLKRPLLLFMGLTALSMVWSNVFRDPVVNTWRSFPFVQLASMLVMILLPAAFLLVGNFLREQRLLRLMTGVFLAAGTAFIISTFTLPGSITAQFGMGGVAPMWFVAFAYSQALLNNRLPRWVRGGLIALCAAFFYRFYSLGNLWISGWLPIIIAVGAITFLWSRKGFLVFGLAFAAVLFSRFDALYEQIVVGNINEGGLQRLDLWQRDLDLVGRHPVLGTGPAGYAVYYMTYNRADARSSHNNYMDVIMQTGVLGFAIFVWFLLRLGVYGWSVHRSTRRDSDSPFLHGLSAGILGAWPAVVVAMMLGDWIIPFAYNQTILGYQHSVYTWMFLGALVSIEHIVKTERRDRRTAPESHAA